MDHQMEIPKETPSPKVYAVAHQCSAMRKGTVLMQPALDPRYHVGYCSRCKEKIVRRSEQ